MFCTPQRRSADCADAGAGVGEERVPASEQVLYAVCTLTLVGIHQRIINQRRLSCQYRRTQLMTGTTNRYHELHFQSAACRVSRGNGSAMKF